MNDKAAFIAGFLACAELIPEVFPDPEENIDDADEAFEQWHVARITADERQKCDHLGPCAVRNGYLCCGKCGERHSNSVDPGREQ